MQISQNQLEDNLNKIANKSLSSQINKEISIDRLIIDCCHFQKNINTILPAIQKCYNNCNCGQYQYLTDNENCLLDLRLRIYLLIRLWHIYDIQGNSTFVFAETRKNYIFIKILELAKKEYPKAVIDNDCILNLKAYIDLPTKCMVN